MQLIDGKELSSTIKDEIAVEVAAISAEGRRPPHLVAVLIGENPASQVYVRNKINSCERVGFKSTLIKKDVDISQNELIALIVELNNDPEVDGFIIQLPLPKHLDENEITMAIEPKKDVDGFHPVNLGRMAIGLDSYVPATPQGIVEMIKRFNIETSGKHAVVLGRSNIVGTPISILLSRKSNTGNATVTICHSRTQNLKEIVSTADIIVAAIGIPNFVTDDMVKEGAVVFDVGINRIDDSTRKRGYRLVGDVDFETVSKKASFITPVPGGVGPMTVCSLLVNTLRSYKKEVYA